MSALLQQPQKLQQIDIIKIYEKKRCLVVDDLTEVRALYKRMLRSFGVRELDTAATSDQTMGLCHNHNYGIIICDYNLDDSRDGQQILEELRHMEMLKYTTLFIIITAETSREMVLGAIENQPDDYITKPISQKLMRTRLDRALLKHEDLFSIKLSMDSKNYSKAIKLCDEKIKSKNRYAIDCIRYKAQIYMMMGKPEEAQKIYESMLRQRHYAWAKIGLAKALMAAGKYENIEPLLKETLKEDHRYIEAHDLLADFYEKTNEPEKAQLAVEKATELSPKSIIRHRRLAQLAEENGDDVACLKAYEESIRWNYNSCHATPEDYLSLARKTVDVAKTASPREAVDKTKKALGLLERMQRRFPERKNKVKSTFIESQLYACQGKENLAKSLLKKAERVYGILDPKDTDARLDYSCAHIMSGDKQKAYKELHLLSKEKKDSVSVLRRIDRISEEPISFEGKSCAAELSKAGINAYQKREYDKSIKIFGDALKMFPNHVGVNLNLVQVIIAKAEIDGKQNEHYLRSKECFSKVGALASDHKQYTRHQFLFKQFNEVYKDYQSMQSQ
ncbi:MAG: DNA-binding response OmpR family regulator/lipopolysaccharide biosynthesis regulator YciM [Candidatus Endobugula sp.]|jgi:DNA-binding response OmpR family regulator/lipopolysaccharide biosynthesis regulator YciM